jgi:hypothetical protein
MAAAMAVVMAGRSMLAQDHHAQALVANPTRCAPVWT